MENYVVKKHWWFWVKSCILLFILLGILFGAFSAINSSGLPLVLFGTFSMPIFIVVPIFMIVPILIFGITYLRWELDKIEVKDGCLYSRIGVISIDKKSIPLEQISFIGETTDIISQWIGFGNIQVQSSAFAKAIEYSCIANPQGLVKYVNEYKSSKL